jgi:hypothetical protein
MAVVTIEHHPELTANKAMEIFKKGFAGKYEVYKWNRLGGARDFVVKKNSLIGVAVKLKQGKDQTSFTFVEITPSIFMVYVGSLYYSLRRSGYRAMMQDVEAFIWNQPEFK